MRLPTVLFFVVMTFLCWGSYGPTLHQGQIAMGHSRWRPFICVGLAYFLIAVVVPWILLRIRPEDGKWTVSGLVWSLLAGVVGAVGALGIILAFEFGGKPVFIMPLVFGCAPVVNTFVTMLMNRSHRNASLPFYVAVAMVALGAAGVLVFKPSVAPAVAQSRQETQIHQEMEDLRIKFHQDMEELRGKLDEKKTRQESSVNSSSPINFSKRNFSKRAERMGGGNHVKHFLAAGDDEATMQEDSSDSDWFNFVKCILAILMTAICWGAYGPTLHKGQTQMEGSRLRPFICVGLAYFLIAVIVPSLVLLRADDGASFTPVGTFWSLIAGSVGAIGALGIIMAFNFGGRPVFVMPLVFGGAPVVNTLISMGQSFYRTGNIGEISWQFVACLAVVMAGAVCVMLFAPRPGKQRDDQHENKASVD